MFVIRSVIKTGLIFIFAFIPQIFKTTVKTGFEFLTFYSNAVNTHSLFSSNKDGVKYFY